MSNLADSRKIAILGLGYVGLPMAICFGRKRQVLGFDINTKRVEELKQGIDRNNDVPKGELQSLMVEYSSDPARLSWADFFIISVPTPVDEANRPDFTPLVKASETVGKAISKGAIVVFESTVYPGATEEICVPVLEKNSGLKCGQDFTVGYSPERINPGDTEHTFETIKKVVSGQDAQTLDIVADIYASVIKAGVHKAPSIKVAEAAKVIENIQRDINISLINELSLIFHRIGIDTQDVLAASKTKWNFLPFQPGLVGGHCIGVDPYYLTHKAEQLGYNPQVILAGRRINDGMGAYIAHAVVKGLLKNGIKSNAKPIVTVLGLTFKENVADIRNTKVIDIVHELERFGVEVQVFDPIALPAHALHEYGIKLIPKSELKPASAIVLAVAHEEIKIGGWDYIVKLLESGMGFVSDVKGILDRDNKPSSIQLWRL